MRKVDFRLLFGIVLILGGALFLLEALDLIAIGGWIWGLAFMVAGAVFLYVYFAQREQWWPLIPGCTLAGIGVGILLGSLFPVLDFLTGVFVLGGIGLSFLLIYLSHRDFWWAIIPAGTLFTLALVTVADRLFIDDVGVPGVLFLGLGLTFAALALLPTAQGRMKWPWIPAVVLGLMGVVMIGAGIDKAGIAVAVVMVAAGLYLILRTARPR
jgi:hypothetical protein